MKPRSGPLSLNVGPIAYAPRYLPFHGLLLVAFDCRRIASADFQLVCVEGPLNEK